MIYQEKNHHLAEPVATCGNRLYVIGSQNGAFPDSWGGHVPAEMHGVWAHPIKLLDGFWFGLQAEDTSAAAPSAAPAAAPVISPHWLSEARVCRAYPTYTEFHYRLGSLHITRQDHVPDDLPGFVIQLILQNQEPFPAPLTLWAEFRADLRPVWLGEQTGMLDAPDYLRQEDARVIFADSGNPWRCVVGPAQANASDMTIQAKGAHVTHGQGCSATFTVPVLFDEQGRAELTFLVAGSDQGETDALAHWQRLHDERAEMLAAKATAYQNLISTSRVHTPNSALNNAMLWTKINAQWLARSVPDFGACAGAGLPEYPWWFGIDTAYAVLPMLQAGQFELVRDSLRLLHRSSVLRNPSEAGRVVHEMSTNGAIYNEGNAVESPTFVRAVHQYWQWTGDSDLLREMYPFCRAAVLGYLLGQCDPDGDLCPSGRSIIETLEMHSGVECIDVAAYTCEALERLADMAEFLHDPIVDDLRGRATELRRRIQTEWWLPEAGLFADVRASKREVLGVLAQLDEAAARAGAQAHDFCRQVQVAQRLFAPELARHADQPDDIDLPWLLRHWVVMCPVEVGIATPEQAARVLARVQSNEFCNAIGMYLHPDRHDVMSINTGLLALAAAKNDHVESALRICANLAAQLSYRTPGTICEALPDQWCFVQLWSNLGVTSPVIEGFLGIAPDAGRKRITIRPQLPDGWDEASVSRLRVGPHALDIRVRRSGPNTFTADVSGAHDFEIVTLP